MKISQVSTRFTKLFAIIALFAMTACSEDDDNAIVIPDISQEGFEFATESQTDFFINSSGDVELTVTANVDHGTTTATEKGFVYGTTTLPEASSRNKVVIVADGDVTATITGLDQSASYFIRGFITTADGKVFYGNEISFSTPDNTADSRTLALAVANANTNGLRELSISVSASDVAIEAPTRIFIEYSTSQDFSDAETLTNNTDISEGSSNTVVSNLRDLAVDQTYFVRAVAEYNDDETVVSEVQELTTLAPAVGLSFPLSDGDYDSAGFLILNVDAANRTVTLVQIPEDEGADEWRDSYEVRTGVDFQNPSQDQALAIKTAIESNQDFCFAFSSTKSLQDLIDCEVEDDFIWTSSISPTDDEAAILFNPATNEAKEFDKTSERPLWLVGTVNF